MLLLHVGLDPADREEFVGRTGRYPEADLTAHPSGEPSAPRSGWNAWSEPVGESGNDHITHYTVPVSSYSEALHVVNQLLGDGGRSILHEIHDGMTRPSPAFAAVSEPDDYSVGTAEITITDDPGTATAGWIGATPPGPTYTPPPAPAPTADSVRVRPADEPWAPPPGHVGQGQATAPRAVYSPVPDTDPDPRPVNAGGVLTYPVRRIDPEPDSGPRTTINGAGAAADFATDPGTLVEAPTATILGRIPGREPASPGTEGTGEEGFVVDGHWIYQNTAGGQRRFGPVDVMTPEQSGHLAHLPDGGVETGTADDAVDWVVVRQGNTFFYARESVSDLDLQDDVLGLTGPDPAVDLDADEPAAIEQSVKVYLVWNRVLGQWEIDSPTVDGYALDGLDGGPDTDTPRHLLTAEDQAEMDRASAADLPDAEELWQMLSDRLAARSGAGVAPVQEPGFVLVDRQHSANLAVAYANLDHANRALKRSVFIEGLVEEDCLDADVSTTAPTGYEVITPPAEPGIAAASPSAIGHVVGLDAQVVGTRPVPVWHGPGPTPELLDMGYAGEAGQDFYVRLRYTHPGGGVDDLTITGDIFDGDRQWEHVAGPDADETASPDARAYFEQAAAYGHAFHRAAGQRVDQVVSVALNEARPRLVAELTGKPVPVTGPELTPEPASGPVVGGSSWVRIAVSAQSLREQFASDPVRGPVVAAMSEQQLDLLADRVVANDALRDATDRAAEMVVDDFIDLHPEVVAAAHANAGLVADVAGEGVGAEQGGFEDPVNVPAGGEVDGPRMV